MSFVLKVDPKRRAGGRFIGRVRDELVKAFLDLKRSEQFTQRQLSDKLNVDRARISRALRGGENLTLRTVAELAWAMKRRVVFYLERIEEPAEYPSTNEVIVQPRRSVTPQNAERLWGEMPKGAVRQLGQATVENV